MYIHTALAEETSKHHGMHVNRVLAEDITSAGQISSWSHSRISIACLGLRTEQVLDETFQVNRTVRALFYATRLQQ